MKNFKALFSLCILFASVSASALTVSNSLSDKSKFGIIFPDGTSIYGNAAAVSTISKQKYTSGPLVVTEVIIDMAGSPTQYRIYNIKSADPTEFYEKLSETKVPEELKAYTQTPDYLKQKAQESEVSKKLTDFTSVPMVTKTYPVTTHAKTAEFIVEDINELEAFYKRFSEDYCGIVQKKTDDLNTQDVAIRGKLYRLAKQSTLSLTSKKKNKQ